MYSIVCAPGTSLDDYLGSIDLSYGDQLMLQVPVVPGRQLAIVCVCTECVSCAACSQALSSALKCRVRLIIPCFGSPSGCAVQDIVPLFDQTVDSSVPVLYMSYLGGGCYKSLDPTASDTTTTTRISVEVKVCCRTWVNLSCLSVYECVCTVFDSRTPNSVYVGWTF